ncbi:unnamed protein product, partial [Meganyctiphanes norvegica]
WSVVCYWQGNNSKLNLLEMHILRSLKHVDLLMRMMITLQSLKLLAAEDVLGSIQQDLSCMDKFQLCKSFAAEGHCDIPDIAEDCPLSCDGCAIGSEVNQ